MQIIIYYKTFDMVYKNIMAQVFCKECFNVISKLDDYKPLKEEIDDIFNINTLKVY